MFDGTPKKQPQWQGIPLSGAYGQELEIDSFGRSRVDTKARLLVGLGSVLACARDMAQEFVQCKDLNFTQ
jgi:hypothetical protein